MPTNADIRFVGVEHVSIPRRFNGLAVSLASQMDRFHAESLLLRELGELSVYRITSAGVAHQVVALACTTDENDADIFSSPFDPPKRLHT